MARPRDVAATFAALSAGCGLAVAYAFLAIDGVSLCRLAGRLAVHVGLLPAPVGAAVGAALAMIDLMRG